MSHPLRSRVLALAGVLQSLRLVRQIADTGHADATQERCAFESVFRIDASSVDAIYGNARDLRPGLMILRDYLGDRQGDEALPKLGMAILQIERRFVADEDMTRRVRAGVSSIATSAEHQGGIHPDIIRRLGELYADTISHLTPKVIVQGNPHYLQQAEIVAEIRALLLASLRSAVLWRQMGGTLWDFVFRRRAMMEAVEEALA